MIRPLSTFSLSLTDVANLVGADFESDQLVTGIANSDSDIESGDLFLAIPGAKVHGASFADAAIQNGAVAILTDAQGAVMTKNLPTIVVADVRSAGALVASALYKDPTRDLHSIGITGTNGKTTVTTLLYQIFQEAGRDSGLIGTVETRIGAETIPSTRTTPEAADLQSLAASMRERHMRHLVMEVSSHAITLNRVKGSHFSIVGFTNLSQDHLDFHGDMQSYFEAKSKLFTFEYADSGYINIDSEYGKKLSAKSEIPVVTLSRFDKAGTWHFTEVHAGMAGTQFSIRGSEGILIESKTQLFGGYNLDNLLMAVAIAHASGVDPIELATIIPNLIGAPGRLEPIFIGQDFTALVDYAHSPDAVENVLAAAREFTSGKVIAVLGCGGDRDKGKRPMMGEALLKGSDIAIFTSDNPRSEEPSEILKDMTSGLTITECSKIITDRDEAIQYAVAQAKAGDTVLILGKGHESGQEIKKVKTPFDDRLQLARAIEARR
ncbi:MurE UDP-N-acetylmuramyl tripeptide synthase [Candidatus Nanopelagicaceae bacterium]